MIYDQVAQSPQNYLDHLLKAPRTRDSLDTWSLGCPLALAMKLAMGLGYLLGNGAMASRVRPRDSPHRLCQ